MSNAQAKVIELIKKLTGETDPTKIYRFVEKLSMVARIESQKAAGARK